MCVSDGGYVLTQDLAWCLAYWKYPTNIPWIDMDLMQTPRDLTQDSQIIFMPDTFHPTFEGDTNNDDMMVKLRKTWDLRV